MSARPSFKQLPLRGSDPAFSAWGLYGDKDELGTLNLLTPDSRKQALAEVQLGTSIPLSLPLDEPRKPMNPARSACSHKINSKGWSNDDAISMDTQCSSHWDGLRHLGYHYLTKARDPQYYNGATQQDLTSSTVLGIDAVAAAGGITARAILVDFAAWAARQGIRFSAFERYEITLDQIKTILSEQNNTTPRAGDILIIRTGWTQQYRKLSAEDQLSLSDRTGEARTHIGVQQDLAMLEWHWSNAFAAVASDTVAYEAWPAKAVSPDHSVCLHEVFLSGWGLRIGESWDLERVAAKCAELQRWSFALVSVPLSLKGGVASPSNAIALF